MNAGLQYFIDYLLEYKVTDIAKRELIEASKQIINHAFVKGQIKFSSWHGHWTRKEIIEETIYNHDVCQPLKSEELQMN